MDALEIARQAAAENRYRAAQKAATQQQTEDELPAPTVYQGYNASSGRAIVRSLGNEPIEVGEIVTNGGLKPGQRVDASSSPGRVAIDAMPRVKPAPLLPEPKGTTQAKFAFLYNAVIEDAVSCFLGGFLPRSGVTPFSKDLPRQIHFLTRSTLIGGCKLPSSPIEFPSEYPLPDLPAGAFPPQGIVKVGRNGASVFYKDEFFRTKPIGYGLWLSVIDENFWYVSTQNIMAAQYKTAQPYLSMTASSFFINSSGFFTGTGTCKSILIDSLTETVETTSINWQSNSVVSEPPGKLRTGTSKTTASGETIILPGITRPFTHASSDILEIGFASASTVNNLYGTVMVDCTKTQSITWHKNGNWDAGDSNWYLFQGDEQTRLDSTPHFSFELLDSERQIPEIGTYTFSGRTFFGVGTFLTGEDNQREIDLTFKNAIAGMSIVWTIEKDDGTCRRAYGHIASAGFENISITSVIVSLVISIEKIIDVPYAFGATANGTIASNTGSVLDFLWAMGIDVGNGSTRLGNGFLGFGGIPVFEANIALTHTNYHWQGSTIYIPQNPPASPNVNADNYAEVWKIVDGKFVLQDRVKKGRRTKLLKDGEMFQDAIAGTYIPGA